MSSPARPRGVQMRGHLGPVDDRNVADVARPHPVHSAGNPTLPSGPQGSVRLHLSRCAACLAPTEWGTNGMGRVVVVDPGGGAHACRPSPATVVDLNLFHWAADSGAPVDPLDAERFVYLGWLAVRDPLMPRTPADPLPPVAFLQSWDLTPLGFRVFALPRQHVKGRRRPG